MLVFTAVGTVTVDPFAPDPDLSDVDLAAPIPPREPRYGHATNAEIRLAASAAVTAHQTDAPAAPAACPVIQSMIAAHAVGEPRTLQIMGAWTAAYQAECDKAADAILAPCHAARTGEGYWTCDVPGGCSDCRDLAAELDDLATLDETR